MVEQLAATYHQFTAESCLETGRLMKTYDSSSAVLHLNTFVTFSGGYSQCLHLKLLALPGWGMQSCSVILSLSQRQSRFPLWGRRANSFKYTSYFCVFFHAIALLFFCVLYVYASFYFWIAECSSLQYFMFFPFPLLSHVTKSLSWGLVEPIWMQRDILIILLHTFPARTVIVHV